MLLNFGLNNIMHTKVQLIANLEFDIELDGTRDIRDVIEDFVIDFPIPEGCQIELIKNEFVVVEPEVDDDDGHLF